MARTAWLGASILLVFAATARAQTVGFDEQKAGEAPKGFTCERTGKGRAGVWRVARDGTAPSATNVLVQSDADPTGYRFPLCVLDRVTAKDVDLSVRFKPVSGAEDQAAGLVFRYRDRDNYYVVRANALEGNVVLYKLEGGKRTDLDPVGAGPLSYGKKAKVQSGSWGLLRVVARGSRFEVHLGGEKVFEVEDATFASPGKAGVWTKADSITRFDDLVVEVLD